MSSTEDEDHWYFVDEAPDRLTTISKCLLFVLDKFMQGVDRVKCWLTIMEQSDLIAPIF